VEEEESARIVPEISDGDDSGHMRPKVTLFGLLIVACILGGVAALTLPTFLRNRAQGQFSACAKSNLHGVGVALKMYATDYDGHYPAELSQLTPNYLSEIPVCPQSGVHYVYQTGAVGQNTQNRTEDYYLLSCRDGHSSLDVPAGFPQYDPEVGLIER
jgi:hypothetical protein